MILLWLGCAAEPEPVPEPSPPPTPVVTQTFTPAPSPMGVGKAVVLALEYDGVGPLHQRYFGDQDIAGALAEGLGTCLRDKASLRVSYNQEKRLGRIRIRVQPENLLCAPQSTSAGFDLLALQPIGHALANYRDAIAGRFDLRVANFRVELEATSKDHVCRLTLGGQFPPDGTTWSPCVEFAGERVCEGKPTEAKRVLSFSEQGRAAYLAACFR